MSQQDLLKKVVRTLTHDIDIVVNLPRSKVHDLAGAFPPPDYYLDEEAVAEAVSGKGMANLIDTTSGDKVDFWLLTTEPFDQSRFVRRYNEDVLGMRIAVSAPEDTILMKLRWSRMSSGSEKQFTDAVRVYEVQYGKLDLAYLHEWALKLGIESDMERLRNEARTL